MKAIPLNTALGLTLMPTKLRKFRKPHKLRKPIEHKHPVELDQQAVNAEIDAILARYGVPQPFPMVHPGRCVSAFDALCVHLGLKLPWEERYKALFGVPPTEAEVAEVAARSSAAGMTPGRLPEAPPITNEVVMLKAASATNPETKTARRRSMARKARRRRRRP